MNKRPQKEFVEYEKEIDQFCSANGMFYATEKKIKFQFQVLTAKNCFSTPSSATSNLLWETTLV